MWVSLALFSGLFSGTAWVLSKCAGSIDPRAAIAVRSGSLLLCALAFVGIFRSYSEFIAIDNTSLWFTIGAGGVSALGLVCYQSLIECGLGWSCAMEKLSIPIIACAEWILFGNRLSLFSLAALGLIGVGAVHNFKEKTTVIDNLPPVRKFLLVAGMIVFTSSAIVLAKFAVRGSSAEVALSIRTGAQLVVLMVWLLLRKGIGAVRSISGKSSLYLLASGASSAIAWLCYFRALPMGNAGAIHALDKLNVLVTAFSGWVLFDERYSREMIRGIGITVAGILLLAVSFGIP